jgi:biotin operon repressor
MKHYTIKKDNAIINPFASAKSILDRTGCEDIKEAIKSLREDGYTVSLVKR